MSPLEFVATPAASPRLRLSGNFSKSGVPTDSKGISGMDSCATSPMPVENVAQSAAAMRVVNRRFMIGYREADDVVGTAFEFRMSFCARHAEISATNSSFGLRQSIS